jgi:hypothetical protein
MDGQSAGSGLMMGATVAPMAERAAHENILG